MKSDINVTPLVDVVLVLLIIFMVVTPMMKQGKDVALPRARNPEKGPAPASPLIVSITPDQKLFVEQDEVSAPELERRLRSALAAAPGRKVLLEGDQSLDVGVVRRVLESARRAGAQGVGFGVEELR